MAVANSTPWLLLVFNLPSKHASVRVEVWRKLKKLGALPLRISGYLLPNNAANQERFEWLAAIIRKHRGEASIALVAAFGGLPHEKIAQLFVEARSKDYQQLIQPPETASPPQSSLSRRGPPQAPGDCRD